MRARALLITIITFLLLSPISALADPIWGNVYGNSQGQLRTNLNGPLTGLVATTIVSGLNDPSPYILVREDGSFVLNSWTNNEIRFYSASGSLVTSISEATHGYGVLDSEGNFIYIIYSGSGSSYNLKKYDTTGSLVWSVSNSDTTPVQFVDDNDDIYTISGKYSGADGSSMSGPGGMIISVDNQYVFDIRPPGVGQTESKLEVFDASSGDSEGSINLGDYIANGRLVISSDDTKIFVYYISSCPGSGTGSVRLKAFDVTDKSNMTLLWEKELASAVLITCPGEGQIGLDPYGNVYVTYAKFTGALSQSGILEKYRADTGLLLAEQPMGLGLSRALFSSTNKLYLLADYSLTIRSHYGSLPVGASIASFSGNVSDLGRAVVPAGNGAVYVVSNTNVIKLTDPY